MATVVAVHQVLAGGPLGAGLPLSCLWVLLPAVTVTSLALPVFDRRDIRVR